MVYRLPELQDHTTCYVVEGEKDADRLWSLGLAATTNPGGAGKWRDDHSQQLLAAGIRTVHVIPDHDEPGERHAAQVVTSCRASGLQVRLVRLPNLPDHGDVSDWLDGGHAVDELEVLVSYSDEQRSRAVAGRLWSRAVDLLDTPAPQPIVEGVVAAGSLSILVGESASGKSFVVLDLAASVSANLDWRGRKVRHGFVVYVGYESPVGLRLRGLRDVGGHTLEHVYETTPPGPLSPVFDRARAETPIAGERFLEQMLDNFDGHLQGNGLTPIVLVVVDTVRASLAGSEDSSEDVSAYLRAVRRLMAHTPAAGWLLLHHSGWQDGENRRKRECGSSSFRGNVDRTLYLEAGPYDKTTGMAALTLSTLKDRDGEPFPPLSLVRRRVTIPGLFDCWGRPVRTCLIGADPRTQQDREADAARALQAEDDAVDLKVLRAIVTRGPLTSKDHIQLAAGIAKHRVVASVSLLVARGWLEIPKQRCPFAPTPGGQQALESRRFRVVLRTTE